jgi:hypothetical protein
VIYAYRVVIPTFKDTKKGYWIAVLPFLKVLTKETMQITSSDIKNRKEARDHNNVLPSIGLSYSPYLTEKDTKRIHIKRYKSGEMSVSTGEVYTPDTKETRSKPPINEGERIVKGLSRRGRTRLRRCANFYDILQGELGHKTMITLTYGDISKSEHKASKQDLDRFLKSLSRYIKKEYGREDVHYVWVAEIQPKRKKRTGEDVIHYHIMTIYYVPSELISKWWNNAVNKPRIKANKPTQELLPHITSCYHAGAYMAKYLSKEGHKIKGNGYNMSQATSKGIKPTFNECIDIPLDDVESLYDNLLNTSKHHTRYHFADNSGLSRVLWLPESNSYAFNEVIETYKANQDAKTKDRQPPNISNTNQNNQRDETKVGKAFPEERSNHVGRNKGTCCPRHDKQPNKNGTIKATHFDTIKKHLRNLEKRT